MTVCARRLQLRKFQARRIDTQVSAHTRTSLPVQAESGTIKARA
jgi:hypothetical protein